MRHSPNAISILATELAAVVLMVVEVPMLNDMMNDTRYRFWDWSICENEEKTSPSEELNSSSPAKSTTQSSQ